MEGDVVATEGDAFPPNGPCHRATHLHCEFKDHNSLDDLLREIELLYWPPLNAQTRGRAQEFSSKQKLWYRQTRSGTSLSHIF